jgi:hypothetical protein
MNDVEIALVVLVALFGLAALSMIIDNRHSERGESKAHKLHRAALRHFAERGEIPTPHEETEYITEVLFDPAAEEAIIHPKGEELLRPRHED